MPIHHRLALLGALLLITIAARAQVSFYGTDNFDDNTFASGRWSSFGTNNGGLWTEANGRLEFTADASSTLIITSNRAQQFVVWSNNTSGNTSYADSWTATATVTLDQSVSTTNGAQMIGLEAFMAGTASGYYGIYLFHATSGSRVFSERGAYNGSGYTRTTLGTTGALAPGFDTTDVLLRISYNGGTNTFTSGYSFDNGTTFYDYGTGASTNTSAWAVAPTTGFGLQFYGALYGNGTLTGPIATSGQMYADNLAVSAVPEPSTYAALAGLAALGFAYWRRRQKTAAAG